MVDRDIHRSADRLDVAGIDATLTNRAHGGDVSHAAVFSGETMDTSYGGEEEEEEGGKGGSAHRWGVIIDRGVADTMVRIT